MGQRNTKRIAVYGLIILLSCMIIFHLLVIVGVFPAELVWGGQLANFYELLIFETIAVVVNLLMLTLVASYAGFFRGRMKPHLLRTAFWVMTILFFLSSVGSFFSESELESVLFAPVSLLMALFSLKLALGDRRKQ